MPVWYVNSEQVAPISAPMLAIVLLPVVDMLSVPGPKYSTMAPVPPLAVRLPANLRMTSLLELQPPAGLEAKATLRAHRMS